MKFIVEMRNAQEHPKPAKKLIIKNFTLKPGNKISPPLWQISGEESYPIHSSMESIVSFLLSFIECVFLHCVMDNISSSFPYTVRALDDKSLDPQCPIKYIVEPNIV